MVLSRETPQATLVEDEAAYGRARRKVFTFVAMLVLLAGGVFTLLQPVMYRSSATVLMSAPTAIDKRMQDADIQGVAIQRRVLTGREITSALSDAVNELGVELDPIDLRKMLDVAAVPETNLLELSASGSEAEELPPLVETWIDVYTKARASDIETRKSTTLNEVQDELDGLEGRLEEARQALNDYRQENEIISMERQENAVLSRLDGLNKALNNAVEAEVKAEAYLDTLKESLAAGEQVVPKSERSDVASMNRRLTQLRGRLEDLQAKYTDDYIMKDARLRKVPQQVEELEARLRDAYQEGTQAELENAERNYRTARESVADLESRLQAHKAEVSDFNNTYAIHQALVSDLSRLEQLNRETQARLVQIEVRKVEKYPQVSVVDWPKAQPVRTGPPYAMLLGGTAGAAFVLGVLAVWLYSYLHPRPAQPAMVTLTGVHMYPQDGVQALGQITEAQERLEGTSAPRLADQSEAENAEDAEEDDPQKGSPT